MWPTGIADWLTYLRRFRHRSAADQALIAGVADIQVRVAEIYDALHAIRSRPVPRVALAFDVVTETTTRISAVVDTRVIPPALDAALYDERIALAQTLRSIQKQLFQLRLVAGIFQTRKLLTSERQRRIIENVCAYRVRQHDTLALIAAHELRARDRWPELVELNDLTWPFIGRRSEHPTARLVEPGEEMMLPAVDQTSQVIPTPAPTVADAYGVDIDLTTKLGQPTFLRGDLVLVGGVPNIEQAIRHRIVSERGSLPLHPEYGCGLHRWVGAEGTFMHARLALFDFVRTVLEDPRIVSVNRRNATLDGPTATLSLEARVIGTETPVRLNAIIPAQGG